MKPLIPTVFLLLSVTAIMAQPTASPDTTQHFLWFTGHWNPQKKKVFIIAASSGGGTATVGDDGGVQLKTEGVDSWNKKMADAEQSEQQFIQQLNNPQDNLDPSTHELYQLLLPDAEQRKQEVHDLKIDPKQNILSPDTKPGQATAGQTKPVESTPSCDQLQADYNQVMTWWTAHKGDKDKDLTYPPPPAFEYNCYACDSNVRKSNEETNKNYVRDFFHPEDSLVRKALGIMRALKLDLDGRTSSSCNKISSSDLAQAVHDLIFHAYFRADKMMRDNQKNFRAATAIGKTWMVAARDVALITGNSTVEDAGFPVLAGLYSQAVSFYYGELKKNDWRQIGNVNIVFALMREYALLSGQESGAFDEYCARLLRIWNGFTLTIELDAKIGKEGGYRLAHLKGQCHIIPCFQEDSNQCYKWKVADDNRQSLLGYLMPSQLQTIDCQLIANEQVFPPPAPKWTYVGTKKYTATLMSLSMDFCNPGHDTIQLSGFSPNPKTAGTWQIPYAGTQNLGVVGMEQYFEDVQAKKKIVDDGEAQKSADAMQQQAEQIKVQMEALKGQMTGAQGGVSYEKMQELLNKTRSIMATPTIGKLLWLDFLIPVENDKPVLVQKVYNAKEINPDEAPIITYGLYTIHIENDGNGKTKPKSPPKK